MRLLVKTAFLAVSVIQFSYPAYALTAMKAIDGLVCMDLNLPDSVLRNVHGDGLPPVYSQPNEHSTIIGTAGGMIYVVEPMKAINGFVEYIRPDWQHAWIKLEYLKPHTDFTCIPSKMSNGRLGFGNGK